jgi:hypothetical protein
MSTPVIFRRLARAEFDDAVDWFEQKQVGLGDRFADDVWGVIARIQRCTLSFTKTFAGPLCGAGLTLCSIASKRIMLL